MGYPESFYIKTGINEAGLYTRVVATDGDDPATTMYIQYADGTIRKWASNMSYVADAGTLWADRTTATYTSEVI